VPFGSVLRKGPIAISFLEFVELAAGLVLCQAVLLLDLPCELVALAGHHVELVVGELAHCSFALPLNCFQFPSMRSQFMMTPFGWMDNFFPAPFLRLG